MIDTTAPMPAPARGLDRLGWRARERPHTGFAHTLGAAGGVFLTAATIAFIVEVTSDDPQVPGLLLTGALAVLGLTAAVLVAGPVRSAGVTAVVLAVPLFWLFALLADTGNGRSDVRAFLLLTLATYVVVYLVKGTRGRAVFLGFALVFLWSWITFEVAGNNSSVVPFEDRVSSSSSLLNGDVQIRSSSDGTDTETATLLVGGAYLLACLVLDRRGYHGIATPFVAVGSVTTLLGAITLGGDESQLAGGLAALGAGAALGLVGGAGHRRASTWIGVIAMVAGALVVIDDVEGFNAGDPLTLAGLFLLFALGAVSLAVLLAPRLHEAADEADSTTAAAPPTPMPPASPAAAAVLEPGPTAPSRSAPLELPAEPGPVLPDGPPSGPPD